MFMMMYDMALHFGSLEGWEIIILCISMIRMMCFCCCCCCFVVSVCLFVFAFFN